MHRIQILNWIWDDDNNGDDENGRSGVDSFCDLLLDFFWEADTIVMLSNHVKLENALKLTLYCNESTKKYK